MLTNWKRSLMIGAGVIVVAGAMAVAGFSLAPRAVNAAANISGLEQFGGRGHRGFHAEGGRGEQNTYLADALGISVDQLQTAMDNARTQAMEQAGTEQSDSDQGARGFGSFGHGFARDAMQPLLAAELGITVDQLETAMTTARQAALDAAVAAGDLSAEEAEHIQAMEALHGYMEPETLTAKALGLTVDELQSARDAGKSMADLLEQQGLTRAEFAAAIQTAHDAAIQQAVTDGVITQEQADQLNQDEGLYVPGGRGGHEGGGRRGHGRHDGFGRPGSRPDRQSDETPVTPSGTGSSDSQL